MPLHFCHEIPQFPKYEYILPNSHCVLTQLVYLMKNGTISKLRCYCAQEHHFTPSSTQFMLSQINPNCTMNFFLGILYVCNGGWILTVVRAHHLLSSCPALSSIPASPSFQHLASQRPQRTLSSPSSEEHTRVCSVPPLISFCQSTRC